MLARGSQITVVLDEAPSPSDPPARIRFGQVLACPQKALRENIPSPVLEPSPRSWSHFVADCCQKLTNLLKIDFEMPHEGSCVQPAAATPSVLVPRCLYVLPRVRVGRRGVASQA